MMELLHLASQIIYEIHFLQVRKHYSIDQTFNDFIQRYYKYIEELTIEGRLLAEDDCGRH